MSGLSPVSVVVANVRRIRRKRGSTAQQLADRLAEVGWEIGRIGVAKLEGGHRKTVTIDNLYALAVALNVSPLSLLTPVDDTEVVAVTPTQSASGEQVSFWVAGESPLRRLGLPDWLDWVRELPPFKLKSVELTNWCGVRVGVADAPSVE
jgi:transcriptional regulator with XRE-family HTH domain